MNKAIFKAYKNKVYAELFRVESQHFFISPFQTIDTPKERE